MARTSLTGHTITIKYRGEMFPNANGTGYFINPVHPYAGMGIELELKKYSGWSVPSKVIETFNNELEPKSYPDFYADPENIVLTYAYYTPFKQIPEKPLNETRTPWNARPIFEIGSEVTILTPDDTPGSVSLFPVLQRQGIIISRNIYTNEKVPILEVVIKPLYPGWRRYGNRTAGQAQNIISPLFGPVPFSFEAKTNAVTQSGALSINLFVKRQGQDYKNYPTQNQYAPEPVTDRISFYGPQVQSGDIVTFKFDSSFPYRATIEAASIGTLNLAKYLYNESSGFVISSPRLFIPGGGATVNVWAEFRVGNTAILTTSQKVNFAETIIL